MRKMAVVVVLAMVLSLTVVCNGGVTSTFVRKVESTVDMPHESDVFFAPGYNAPEQVHITQGNQKGTAMIVSWVTMAEPGSSVYNTKYYYKVGIGQSERQFWFVTPPEVGPDVPYTFGLMGDLGQTFDSNMTLAHYEANPRKGQTVLFLGELSYADDHSNHDQVKWDTFGRFIERNKYTPQYQWLEQELPKVNRSETAWLIAYNYHYMEGESMRVQFESWFVQHKVDVVFAGHVHAYERSERVSNIANNIGNGKCSPVKDQSAPVYITIGDGGNIEGLATNMREPQPDYSAYREASFGHAIFDIKSRTHAYYSWHRNDDGAAVKADSMWFFNRYHHPVDDSTSPQC
ncbi:unnamed protein product [Malus baccata var. baccata]